MNDASERDDIPTSGGSADDVGVVPLAEERLVVGKQEVERVAATIRLRTREEEVAFTETLAREHVDIERVPVDRIVDALPATREEGDVTVIPVVEEVLVKRFRVIEEVRIRRRAETVEVSDTVTLRQQQAHVETADEPAKD